MHRILALALTTCLVWPGGAGAQEWALGGYDAVGFAQQGRPIPGRSDITTLWRGKVWHFATEENRARFEANPRAFVPGFGGLCPVSLAEGKRVPGDPQHVVVIGDTLYLLRSGHDERRLREAPRQVLGRAAEMWAQLR